MILVWANLHASVILALALIGPFALEAMTAPDADRWRAARQWGLFGIGALAAALITPFGVAGLLFPLQVSGMASLNSIVEWRPPDFQHPQPLEAALLAGVFILARGGVRLPLMRLGLLMVLIHLALGHTRHQVLLAVIGGLIVAEAVGGAPRPDRAAGKAPVAVPLLAAVLAMVLIGARLAAPIVWRDGPVSPISALAHVPPDLRARPVLNGYGMGGYLIFQGVRPFIDGRTDMYGDAFNARYDAAMAAGGPALEAVLNDDRIAWTILEPDAPAVKALDSDPGWRRLYADRFAVIHVRATATS